MKNIKAAIKRGIALCLSTGLLSGCQDTDTLQEAKSIRIGVTVYDQYDTFISQLIACFSADLSAKEKETGTVIHIEVYNSANIQTTQNSQVE